MSKNTILRVIAMVGLLLIMVVLTLYFHGVLKSGKVFTHFFYIPIALASLWWKRKGVYVAVFLSVFLMFSHIFSWGYSATAADYVRAFMFLVIGGIIAILSEQLVREKKAKELFATESVTDALTGLRNYTFFKKNADILFDISKDYKSPFSLVIMDINDFKKINDTYGHKTGDLVLQNFGTAAMKAFRSSDIIIRYGGDEFVALLPRVSRERLGQIIGRLKENIQKSYVQCDGKVVSYGFSWGASEYDGGCRNIDEMFKKADNELYATKKQN